MIATVQPHPISEASSKADAAYARYFELAREGVWLWRHHGTQEAKDANRAEREAARLEWRRLAGLAGGGA